MSKVKKQEAFDWYRCTICGKKMNGELVNGMPTKYHVCRRCRELNKSKKVEDDR